jgi:hypothetical protein
MPKRKTEEDSVSVYKKFTYGENTQLEDILYLSQKSKKDQSSLLSELAFLHRMTSSFVPVMFRLLESSIPVPFKMIAYKKILTLDTDPTGKVRQWIDSFLRIPFYQTIPFPVPEKHSVFLKECETILDSCTFGMKDAKHQFLQLIGKWLVNPDSMGTAIALKGPMGTGKTTLIKHGISKILNRPFAFVP